MDLKTVQTELHRMAELADRWQQPQDMTAIERDLLLTRLRDLYEGVLFGVEPNALPTPEPLQGAQLLQQEPAATPAAEPTAAVAAPTTEAAASVSATPEAPETADAVAEPAPEPESEPTETAAPVVEDAPVSEPEPIEAAPAAEAVEPAAETAAATESNEAADEPVTLDADAFLSLDGLLRPTEGKAADERKPSPFGNLFEDDADFVQHRRKQQVIMSLYDAAPAPEKQASAETSTAPEMPEAPAEVPAEMLVGFGAEPQPTEAPINAFAAPATVVETVEAILEETPASEPEAAIEETVEIQTVSQENNETDSAPEEAPETPAVPSAESAPQVLGDVIAPHVQTLGESIAPPRDIAAELRHREPVTDLRRAVGINDKFLLIRDLFNGNGSLYEITIRRLNEFDNLDDCLIYIAEHFAWNPNSDGAKLLMDLLERKFS